MYASSFKYVSLVVVTWTLGCHSFDPVVAPPVSEVPSGDFSIIVLPDTQGYVGKDDNLFLAQTRWVAENRDRLAIQYVVHLGDIVNWNVDVEWRRARKALSLLDAANVPYALAIGNHDMGKGGSAKDRSTGLHRFFHESNLPGVNRPLRTFEQGKLENALYQFAYGNFYARILVLEFGPRDDVLKWAEKVLVSTGDAPTILVTHAYLYSNGQPQRVGDRFHPREKGMSKIPGNTINDGLAIWDKFVRKQPSIRWVLSGHVTNGGAARLVSTNTGGEKVYQMLANYQEYQNGGDGWLRILQFSPTRGRLFVWTYSPSRGEYWRDPQHEFRWRLP